MDDDRKIVRKKFQKTQLEQLFFEAETVNTEIENKDYQLTLLKGGLNIGPLSFYKENDYQISLKLENLDSDYKLFSVNSDLLNIKSEFSPSLRNGKQNTVKSIFFEPILKTLRNPLLEFNHLLSAEKPSIFNNDLRWKNLRFQQKEQDFSRVLFSNKGRAQLNANKDKKIQISFQSDRSDLEVVENSNAFKVSPLNLRFKQDFWILDKKQNLNTEFNFKKLTISEKEYINRSEREHELLNLQFSSHLKFIYEKDWVKQFYTQNSITNKLDYLRNLETSADKTFFKLKGFHLSNKENSIAVHDINYNLNSLKFKDELEIKHDLSLDDFSQNLGNLRLMSVEKFFYSSEEEHVGNAFLEGLKKIEFQSLNSKELLEYLKSFYQATLQLKVQYFYLNKYSPLFTIFNLKNLLHSELEVSGSGLNVKLENSYKTTFDSVLFRLKNWVVKKGEEGRYSYLSGRDFSLFQKLKKNSGEETIETYINAENIDVGSFFNKQYILFLSKSAEFSQKLSRNFSEEFDFTSFLRKLFSEDLQKAAQRIKRTKFFIQKYKLTLNEIFYRDPDNSFSLKELKHTISPFLKEEDNLKTKIQLKETLLKMKNHFFSSEKVGLDLESFNLEKDSKNLLYFISETITEGNFQVKKLFSLFESLDGLIRFNLEKFESKVNSLKLKLSAEKNDSTTEVSYTQKIENLKLKIKKQRGRLWEDLSIFIKNFSFSGLEHLSLNLGDFSFSQKYSENGALSGYPAILRAENFHLKESSKKKELHADVFDLRSGFSFHREKYNLLFKGLVDLLRFYFKSSTYSFYKFLNHIDFNVFDSNIDFNNIYFRSPLISLHSESGNIDLNKFGSKSLALELNSEFSSLEYKQKAKKVVLQNITLLGALDQSFSKIFPVIGDIRLKENNDLDILEKIKRTVSYFKDVKCEFTFNTEKFDYQDPSKLDFSLTNFTSYNKFQSDAGNIQLIQELKSRVNLRYVDPKTYPHPINFSQFQQTTEFDIRGVKLNEIRDFILSQNRFLRFRELLKDNDDEEKNLDRFGEELYFDGSDFYEDLEEEEEEEEGLFAGNFVLFSDLYDFLKDSKSFTKGKLTFNFPHQIKTEVDMVGWSNQLFPQIIAGNWEWKKEQQYEKEEQKKIEEIEREEKKKENKSVFESAWNNTKKAWNSLTSEVKKITSSIAAGLALLLFEDDGYIFSVNTTKNGEELSGKEKDVVENFILNAFDWFSIKVNHRFFQPKFGDALKICQSPTKEQAKTIRLLAQKSNIPFKNINCEELYFYADNLESLDLNTSLIKDVSPLIGLSNLRQLNLSFNQIEDISPLQYLGQLEVLNLSNNQIRATIGLSKLVRLKTLNLSNNEIENFKGLNSINQLEKLEMRRTRLRKLDFLNKYKQLKYLDISENNITSLNAIRSSKKLKTLKAFSNQVKNASVLKYLINLKSLNLSNNPLKSCSPKNLTSLRAGVSCASLE